VKRRWPAVVLSAALIAAGATLALVAARGPAPAVSMDDRVRQVASTLRCPVCVDLSVADSPSLTARQIRATIAQQLADGRTPTEIRDFFVARYGSTILLTPAGNGVDLVAWIAPALLVAFGLGLLAFTLRRWSRAAPGPESPAPAEALTDADRALLDRELAAAEAEAE
jgi:cytochrome c-type biogenesis protein CcmH